MTTIDGVLTPEADPVVATRRRVWPRVVAAFAVGFLVAVGLVGGTLLLNDRSYEGRVLPGVHVGDVDLSGLDRDQATAALEAAYAGFADGRVVVKTSAGDVEVPYAAFSRRLDTERLITAALSAGRDGTPIERAIIQPRLALTGLRLEPDVVFDSDALTSSIEAAVSRLDRAAVDSVIVRRATSIDVTPSTAGQTFDGASAAASAVGVVGSIDAPSEIVVQAPSTTTPAGYDLAMGLQARAAADRMIKDVKVTLGKKHWKIKASTVRGWIRFPLGADGTPWPVADEPAIARSLKKVEKAVKRDAISAKYLKTTRGKIVGVVAAKDGRRLDQAATAAVIAKALDARAASGTSAPVKVKVAKVEPKLTTGEALKKAPLMVELASWKTWFPINDHNYFGANIWQPAKKIDGTVLMPGQKFEWWSRIGPVSSATGFGPGGFIAGNHTEPTGALGGGMCSSSTTLFNAALRAGLKMGARSNHKYYIYRYPLGLDATVSKTRGGGSQTMSFTNDMKHPIVIRTYRYRSGGKGWVRYEIWGIPDGRKVSLSKPSVSNVRKAVTKTVYVSTLKKGVREQTEFPANGMDVAVSRVVRKGGKVIHRETYRTHYVLWNGRIEVGR